MIRINTTERNNRVPQKVAIIQSRFHPRYEVLVVFTNGKTEWKHNFNLNENKAAQAYAANLAAELGVPVTNK